LSTESVANEFGFSASPVPVKRGHDVTISSSSTEPFEMIVINSTGQRLKQNASTESASINTTDLASGIYFISFTQAGKTSTKRILILE